MLRSRHGTIKEIARDPELMAEITLLPLAELEMDAAIMFADIMLPLAALGIDFELVDGVGPVVSDPIRSAGQIERLPVIAASEAVPTLFEAIRITRKELDGRVPLIGFAGAPFTLAGYLIEGKPSRDLHAARAFMLAEPAAWAALMDRLTDLAIDYLCEQAEAGVEAIQLFDSWVGALSPNDYRERVLPYTTRIFEATRGPRIPRIHFGTGTAALLELMASAGSEVIGVDWRVPLDAAWQRIGHDKAIQGNLDPAALLGPPDLVRDRARDVLRHAAGRPGHIFNLGHGVLPDTPLDNLKLLVEVVHEYRVDE
jgi:uroporphyrinogen decarboxylase